MASQAQLKCFWVIGIDVEQPKPHPEASGPDSFEDGERAIMAIELVLKEFKIGRHYFLDIKAAEFNPAFTRRWRAMVLRSACIGILKR